MKLPKDPFTYLQIAVTILIFTPALLAVSFLLWGAAIATFQKLIGG